MSCEQRADACDRSGEADAEVQIARREERCEAEEARMCGVVVVGGEGLGGTKGDTGDRLSHVAEEAGCMLAAFSFIAVRPSA